MFKTNEGTLDRALRIIVGLALIAVGAGLGGIAGVLQLVYLFGESLV